MRLLQLGAFLFIMYVISVDYNGKRTPDAPVARNQSHVERISPEVSTTPVVNDELSITDIKIGNGEEARCGQQILVRYNTFLPDGTVLEPIENSLIIGNGKFSFENGMDGMKTGGLRQIVVPESISMLYGKKHSLGFKIELINIESSEVQSAKFCKWIPQYNFPRTSR